MEQAEPRRLQCLETVPMEEEEEEEEKGKGQGGRRKRKRSCIRGVFSIISAEGDEPERKYVSIIKTVDVQLLLKTKDLIKKVFYPDCVDFLKNNTVWKILQI